MEKEHELLHNWTLFLHIESQSDTYVTAYKEAISFDTCEGWARVFNNVPDAGTLASPYCEIYCDNERVVAYSIFKDGIKPQWEDERNASGCEWGCRQELDKEYVSEVWKHVVASMVCGDLNVLGARVVNKNTHIRNITKIEVWLGEEDDPAEIYGTLQNIISRLNMDVETPNFQLIHHDIRNKETFDFNEKRRRKKNRYEKYKIRDV
tara:strand:+ start:243 stop:863 length:621 start_codon:yes stop_codon:yes gene_type:complete